MDAVTAMSGSGPAYFFLFVESLVDAGVANGLSQATATELAVQTMAGSAEMLLDRLDAQRKAGGDEALDTTPARLRAVVTSPGDHCRWPARTGTGWFAGGGHRCGRCCKTRSEQLGITSE